MRQQRRKFAAAESAPGDSSARPPRSGRTTAARRTAGVPAESARRASGRARRRWHRRGGTCRSPAAAPHSWRSPSSESRSMVDGSLQCRSSRTSTRVHVGGQRLDESSELAQHALGSDRLQRLPQRSLIVVADQPRHLRQPRRRDAAQQCPQAAGIGPARQPLQRLEHRQIRFPRPVLLDAERRGRSMTGAGFRASPDSRPAERRETPPPGRSCRCPPGR